MNALHRHRSAGEFHASLAAEFSGGATWPIDRSALTALVDMGMSDEAIARYFSVDARHVALLRREFGLSR